MFVSSSVCVFPFPSVRYHGELWDVNICTNNQSSGDGWPGQLSVVSSRSPRLRSRDPWDSIETPAAKVSKKRPSWTPGSIRNDRIHTFPNQSYQMSLLTLKDSKDILTRCICHWSEELTAYIKKKRRFVLVAVTSIFAVTTIIMVMSVIHVEMNQAIVGYEECFL